MTTDTPGLAPAGTDLTSLMLIRAFLPHVSAGRPWTGKLKDPNGQAVLDTVRPRLADDERFRLTVMTALARHAVAGLSLALNTTDTAALDRWLAERVDIMSRFSDHRSELVAARLIRHMVADMAARPPVDVPDGVADIVREDDADLLTVSLACFCAGMLLNGHATLDRALQVVDAHTEALLPRR